MKFGIRKPFTLLLCLLLITFMLYGPYFIKEPTIENIIDKAFIKENNWKGVITVWDYPRVDNRNGYKYTWMYKKIKAFERKYPGVFIEFKGISRKDGLVKIETAIKANDYPDIAPIGAESVFHNNKSLTKLNKYLSKDELSDFKDEAISSVTTGNDIYGIPYMLDTYCLLLNKDRFSERGVDLPKNGIWTYDTFVKALKKLTYDQDGDGENDYFGFNSYVAPNVYYLWGILLSDGATITQDGKYSFAGDRAVSGLEKIVDLKHKYGVTPEGFGSDSGLRAWNSFAVKKTVAVYPTTVSNGNVIKLLSRNGKGFNYDVASYPIGESGLPVNFGSRVDAYGVLKQENRDKEEMCVRFIKYICDEKSKENLIYQGVFPAKKSMGNIYENDKMMNKLADKISVKYKGEKVDDWKYIEDILQSQIRMAILGKKTPSQAVEDAYSKVLELNNVDRSGGLRR